MKLVKGAIQQWNRYALPVRSTQLPLHHYCQQTLRDRSCNCYTWSRLLLVKLSGMYRNKAGQSKKETRKLGMDKNAFHPTCKEIETNLRYGINITICSKFKIALNRNIFEQECQNKDTVLAVGNQFVTHDMTTSTPIISLYLLCLQKTVQIFHLVLLQSKSQGWT